MTITVDDDHKIISAFIQRPITYGDLVAYFGKPTKVTGYGRHWLHVCWTGIADSYAFHTQGLASLYAPMYYVNLYNTRCY